MQDNSAVRVDKVTASRTVQQGTGNEGFAIREGVSTIKLFDQRLVAARTTELAVECIQCLGLG